MTTTPRKKKTSFELGWTIARKVWEHPANRGQRFTSLVRAVSWQAWKRATRWPLDVRFSEGFIVRCHPDSNSASNVIYFNRLFDWDEMGLMRALLRPGDGFLDGGANIGAYSMLAAALVGARGRVLAFEPFGKHADRCRENARLNGFAQVEVREKALGRELGRVRFVVNRDVSNRIVTSTDGDAPTMEVPLTTLDAELDDGGSWFLGKLDLEGIEVDALSGARRALTDATPALWMIEVNEGLLRKRGSSVEELQGLLEAHDFDTFTFDARARQLHAAPIRAMNGGNVFAVARRRLREVEARLGPAGRGAAFEPWTLRTARPTWWRG